MPFEIESTPWFCPECGSGLDADETAQVAELLTGCGHCQAALYCRECGESLTADISETAVGSATLSLAWGYP